MANPVTDAQIVAKQRLQHLIAGAVAAAWGSLPHYDQAQVDQFLSTVIPLTAAANQQSARLTEAYLSRILGRPPQGLNVPRIIAGIRNGTTPAEVYHRPFVTVWTALKNGTPWAQAVKMGSDRASSAASMDVQLSFTHTLRESATMDTTDRIVGYQRVPDASACLFCLAASGSVYRSDDLLPLHNGCGCGAEPLTETRTFTRPLSTLDGPGDVQVAVHEHGELGPLLTNAEDAFTGPSQID